MSKRRLVGPIVLTAEEWRGYQERERLLVEQNRLLRQLVARLEETIRALEGRSPPPPDWA